MGREMEGVERLLQLFGLTEKWEKGLGYRAKKVRFGVVVQVFGIGFVGFFSASCRYLGYSHLITIACTYISCHRAGIDSGHGLDFGGEIGRLGVQNCFYLTMLLYLIFNS